MALVQKECSCNIENNHDLSHYYSTSNTCDATMAPVMRSWDTTYGKTASNYSQTDVIMECMMQFDNLAEYVAKPGVFLLPCTYHLSHSISHSLLENAAGTWWVWLYGAECSV